MENVRVKMVRDYLLFYETNDTELIVLTIWDTRRDEKTLDIKTLSFNIFRRYNNLKTCKPIQKGLHVFFVPSLPFGDGLSEDFTSSEALTKRHKTNLRTIGYIRGKRRYEMRMA
ncbi:MAG: hypothetical protein QM751_04025 [Paludibacteraceae bacterium]